MVQRCSIGQLGSLLSLTLISRILMSGWGLLQKSRELAREHGTSTVSWIELVFATGHLDGSVRKPIDSYDDTSNINEWAVLNCKILLKSQEMVREHGISITLSRIELIFGTGMLCGLVRKAMHFY